MYETSLEDGVEVTRVEPYVFTYTMHCKRRWIGRQLEEVLCSEFKANPASYYKAALADGRIRLNGRFPDRALRDGDVVSHVAHRHEPPVCGGFTIVGETAAILAVDKPASLPMHPCGSYHHNSLTAMLRSRGYDVRQVHRLDRLTSGLVLLAKTADAARDLCEQIGAGKTAKTYVARVRGDFPTKAPPPRQGTEPPLKRLKESEAACAARANDHTWRRVGDVLEVDVALACQSHKEGVYKCVPLSEDPNAKPSRTRFLKLGKFADGTSLVECRPCTGRTHQIRLHLQWLGHPIANDPCYGGHLNENVFPPDETPPEAGETVERLPGEDDASFACRACFRCRHGDPNARLPHCRYIWLHALRYAVPGSWSFETQLPSWARLT